MHPILDRLPEYEIQQTFEDTFREVAALNDVGFFEVEVVRDPEVTLKLRIASMVGKAGEVEFQQNPELQAIVVQFPEGPVTYRFVEAISVSGLEIEVLYRPEA